MNGQFSSTSSSAAASSSLPVIIVSSVLSKKEPLHVLLMKEFRVRVSETIGADLMIPGPFTLAMVLLEEKEILFEFTRASAMAKLFKLKQTFANCAALFLFQSPLGVNRMNLITRFPGFAVASVFVRAIFGMERFFLLALPSARTCLICLHDVLWQLGDGRENTFNPCSSRISKMVFFHSSFYIISLVAAISAVQEGSLGTERDSKSSGNFGRVVPVELKLHSSCLLFCVKFSWSRILWIAAMPLFQSWKAFLV